jgi:hypothetical protein
MPGAPTDYFTKSQAAVSNPAGFAPVQAYATGSHNARSCIPSQMCSQLLRQDSPDPGLLREATIVPQMVNRRQVN